MPPSFLSSVPPPGVARQVPLAPLTTLGVGGPARFYAAPKDAAALAAVLHWAREAHVATFLLGGGSNLVVADAGVDGLVVRLPPPREVVWTDGPQHAAGADYVRWPGAAEAAIAVGAAAPGEAWAWVDGACGWDELARATVAAGLCGLECTVGIPGTLGASVAQNVGAYGQQLSDVLVAVALLRLADGERLVVPASACALRYRHSRFKADWRGCYLVQAVQLRLRRAAAPARWPEHAGLRAALGDAAGAGPVPTSARIAEAVLRLRGGKSMLRNAADANARSAGSFFVNPEVDGATAARLRAAHPEMPWYPVREGARHAAGVAAGDGASAPAPAPGDAAPAPAKLAAGWLIEHAGFGRGHRFAEVQGRVGLSAHHALALVNTGAASAADVVAAAAVVRRRVGETFGVWLEAEPQFLGFASATPYR